MILSQVLSSEAKPTWIVFWNNNKNKETFYH